MSRKFKVDLAIALVLLVVFEVLLFAGGIGEPEPGWRRGDAFGVVLTALATVPLAWRRRVPTATLVLSAGAGTALNALDYAGEVLLAPAVSVYTLAAAAGPEVSHLRPIAVIAAVFAGMTAVGLLVGESGTGMVSLGAVWAAAWFVGIQSRQRGERLSALEERARQAEREAERERLLAAAEERARIARELHDSAAHSINAILLQLQAARVLREREPDRAEAALDTVERVARETITEIDGIVGALRERGPADVMPTPGVDAVEALLDRHRAGGLAVQMDVRGERRRLAPSVDRAVYRIVQEALTNAARYGEGSAEVVLDFANGALVLDVSNPIRAGALVRIGGGHGIDGMRERASLCAGELEAGQVGRTFRVRARLPYRREGR
jgi:signal transduction histidine kinase